MPTTLQELSFRCVGLLHMKVQLQVNRENQTSIKGERQEDRSADRRTDRDREIDRQRRQTPSMTEHDRAECLTCVRDIPSRCLAACGAVYAVVLSIAMSFYLSPPLSSRLSCFKNLNSLLKAFCKFSEGLGCSLQYACCCCRLHHSISYTFPIFYK